MSSQLAGDDRLATAGRPKLPKKKSLSFKQSFSSLRLGGKSDARKGHKRSSSDLSFCSPPLPGELAQAKSHSPEPQAPARPPRPADVSLMAEQQTVSYCGPRRPPPSAAFAPSYRAPAPRGSADKTTPPALKRLLDANVSPHETAEHYQPTPTRSPSHGEQTPRSPASSQSGRSVQSSPYVGLRREGRTPDYFGAAALTRSPSLPGLAGFDSSGSPSGSDQVSLPSASTRRWASNVGAAQSPGGHSLRGLPASPRPLRKESLEEQWALYDGQGLDDPPVVPPKAEPSASRSQSPLGRLGSPFAERAKSPPSRASAELAEHAKLAFDYAASSDAAARAQAQSRAAAQRQLRAMEQRYHDNTYFGLQTRCLRAWRDHHGPSRTGSPPSRAYTTLMAAAFDVLKDNEFEQMALAGKQPPYMAERFAQTARGTYEAALADQQERADPTLRCVSDQIRQCLGNRERSSGGFKVKYSEERLRPVRFILSQALACEARPVNDVIGEATAGPKPVRPLLQPMMLRQIFASLPRGEVAFSEEIVNQMAYMLEQLPVTK